MKQLCLLAVVVASVAGCANTPQPGAVPHKERVADAYVPVGTMIPRKRTPAAQGATPTSEVDLQALDNERTMSAATVNSR